MPPSDKLSGRGVQGGSLEPVIIAQTYEGVIFTPGLPAVFTVGAHQGPVTVPNTEEVTIVKIATATHLQLQTLFQNIRYTIDGSEATIDHGFQLAAGSISTIPVATSSVRVFPEGAGASLQFQWIRSG